MAVEAPALMRRGLALVLVVGVLGILAVLGSAFMVLSRLERKSASLRTDSTRAYLLARSGLEHAMAALDAGQDADYAGEDYNNNGLLDGVEVSAQVYRTSTLERDACPARHALRPSLYVEDRLSVSSPKDPALRTVDGRPRGYSGGFGGDRGHWGIKVLGGGIWVNGGDPAAAPTAGYNAVLRRILGDLAEAVDRDNGGADDGQPANLTDGQALVDRRPRTPRGWEGWEQIRDLALGGSQARLDALRPYLALRAQSDLKVIAANAVNALNAPTECWSYVKQGSTFMGFTRSTPSFEVIGGKVVGRAPVDLAWARRRRPVLVALLAGLRGYYLRERDARIDDGMGTGERLGYYYPPPAFSLSWTAADDCRATADRILQSTSELRTWEQWNAFCDTLMLTTPALPASDIPLTRQAKRDMLKANFNPNSDLNKCNPDPSMARLSDKEDFWTQASPVDNRYSTEFNLLPLCGGRVCAVGRVLDRQGRLVASRELSAEVSPHRFFRLTAQSELVAGDLGRPDLAGDERTWRVQGSAPYILPALDGETTFGHKIFAGGGASLQTGPDPHGVWTLGSGRPAAYDGQLRLATVETADGEFGPTMRFLARWTEGYHADDVGNGVVPMCQTDVWMPPATSPVRGAGNPGNLYPDGLFVEWQKVPGYPAKGNMAATRGVLSFWLKPAFDASKLATGDYARRRILFNHTRQRTSVPPSPVTGPDTAMFYLGFIGNGDFNTATAWQNRPNMPFSMLERSLLDAGGADEMMMGTPVREAPHRWTLWSYLWDVDPAVDVSLGVSLRLDRGQPPSELGVRKDFYGDPTTVQGVPPAFEFDQPDGYTLADPSTLPPAVFFLGNRGKGWLYSNRDLNDYAAPDATYDEFAIYDLGPDAAAAFVRFPELTDDRFEAGRFYKGSAYPSAEGLRTTPAAGVRDAGEWFSAPVLLDPAGYRLHRMAWTQVVPRGLKGPAGVLPEDGDAGPEGRIALELAHPDVQVPAALGADYAVDAFGGRIDALFTGAREERIERRMGAGFRIHAVFQPNLSDPLNTAILDPLVLDDVTLSYWPLHQPRIAAWREGE